MNCPRKSCNRWIWKDNKICEYCRYDIDGHYQRIAEHQWQLREKRRIEFEKQQQQDKEWNKLLFWMGLILITALVAVFNHFFHHEVALISLLPYVTGFFAFLMMMQWERI